MSFVYPRLKAQDAEEHFQRLNQEYLAGDKIRYTGDFRHPRAHFPNGEPVPFRRLDEIHSKLVEHVPNGRRMTEQERNGFDVAAGQIFVRVLEEDGRAQATDMGMWAFLSLVAFPDIALARFTPEGSAGLKRERFVGDRRNVFYTAYLRVWILGDLIHAPDAPLLQDELVGIVDRQISTDHRLARSLARAILAYGGSDRRAMVRAGLKSIRFKDRITDFSAYSDEELDSLVKRVMYETVE